MARHDTTCPLKGVTYVTLMEIHYLSSKDQHNVVQILLMRRKEILA